MAIDPFFNNLVTGIVGLGSAGLLWTGARAQRALELIKMQRSETAQRRTARNDLYVEYLNAVDRVKDVGVVIETVDEVWAWWREFEAVDNKIELFASEEVMEASYGVYNALNSVFWGGINSKLEEDTLADAIANRFNADDGGFQDARRRMLDVMRLDVTDD